MGRFFGYWPGHYWAKIFCWLTLVRVEVHGAGNINPDTSYVFVANHQSAYDIFAIYGWLGHNFRWMMKKPLEKIPLVGYSCKVSGHIFVDNSSPSAVKATMQAAEKRLAGGMSVVVFPEGSRTLDGKMHTFRRGAYSLAMEFGLPVVPVTIDGAYNIMRRKRDRLPPRKNYPDNPPPHYRRRERTPRTQRADAEIIRRHRFRPAPTELNAALVC